MNSIYHVDYLLCFDPHYYAKICWSILNYEPFQSYQLKAFVFKGSPLTTADLGSFLNFAQLACKAKFKIEPKCAAVKLTLLTEIALEKSQMAFKSNHNVHRDNKSKLLTCWSK